MNGAVPRLKVVVNLKRKLYVIETIIPIFASDNNTRKPKDEY